MTPETPREAGRQALEAALVEGLTGLRNDEGPVRVAVMSPDGGISLGQEAGIAALLADAVLRAAPATGLPAAEGLRAEDFDIADADGVWIGKTTQGREVGPKARALIAALSEYDDWFGAVLEVVDEAADRAERGLPLDADTLALYDIDRLRRIEAAAKHVIEVGNVRPFAEYARDELRAALADPQSPTDG